TSPVRCGASTAVWTCRKSSGPCADGGGRAPAGGRGTVFSRIAVINRGEPAVRLIRAVRELNAEHGYGTRVIALHTEAERRATFVRAADEAVLLRETGEGNPYLDHAELARALRAGRAAAARV